LFWIVNDVFLLVNELKSDFNSTYDNDSLDWRDVTELSLPKMLFVAAIFMRSFLTGC
jgi:hypothetical protein